MNMPFQKRNVVFDSTNCEVSPQKKHVWNYQVKDGIM